MAWSKTTLISTFAILGFLLGSVSYFAINWMIENNWVWIFSIPLPQLIASPGFISGLAGSLLAVIAIYVYAHFSKGE